MTCPHCQFKIPQDATFCTHCGRRLDRPAPVAVACPWCGQQSVGDLTFCPHCGKPLAVSGTTAKVLVHTKWYERWWGMILLLLLVGPLGIILSHFTWKSKLPATIKWGFSVVIFLGSWFVQITLIRYL